MMHIAIPGYHDFELEYLVFDYNGTLAIDGIPKPQVLEQLAQLARTFRRSIVTADTYGVVQAQVQIPEVHIQILEKDRQCERKAEFVRQLGAAKTVAIGNGYNDHLMLREAALGMAVIQAEGAAYHTIANADLVFTNILEALECLRHPQRLIASLRR
jgi:soluble P-type ATPase